MVSVSCTRANIESCTNQETLKNNDTYIIHTVIGVSLSEPYSNVENGKVVYGQRTMANNGIVTSYCSLVQWFM